MYVYIINDYKCDCYLIYTEYWNRVVVVAAAVVAAVAVGK